LQNPVTYSRRIKKLNINFNILCSKQSVICDVVKLGQSHIFYHAQKRMSIILLLQFSWPLKHSLMFNYRIFFLSALFKSKWDRKRAILRYRQFEMKHILNQQLSNCFSPSEHQITSKGLFQAVRSFLHFSQLSAWYSSTRGQEPKNVFYRITIPGENFSTKFSQTSIEEHFFPPACKCLTKTIYIWVILIIRDFSAPPCDIFHRWSLIFIHNLPWNFKCIRKKYL
jgi:hypothetical protein